jgi:transposase
MRAGLLDKTQRKLSRHWTDEQDQELILLFREGLTTRQIARRLGRSRDSVQCHCQQLGGIDWLRRPKDGLQVRTVSEVAQLFGVGHRVVQYWLRRGWIEGQRNSKRKGCETLISDVSLVALLSKHQTWLTWKPERMTDPVWQKQAAWERRRNPHCWLSLKQAAARASSWSKTLWRAIAAGTLPAQRHGRFWFVWSADLDKWSNQK